MLTTTRLSSVTTPWSIFGTSLPNRWLSDGKMGAMQNSSSINRLSFPYGLSTTIFGSSVARFWVSRGSTSKRLLTDGERGEP